MRKNKTSLTAHHFMSASTDSPSHSLPASSCLFRRDTIKMHPPVSLPSDLSFFSPLPGLWQIVQYNLSTLQPASVRAAAFVEPTYVRTVHTHTQAARIPRVRHAKWDKHLAAESERKTEVKSICPLSAIHWSPVMGWPLQKKTSKWNCSAAFEYKQCDASVRLRRSGGERTLTDELTDGLKCLCRSSF